MKTLEGMMREFHTANKQLINLAPVTEIAPAVAMLRARLMIEELGELAVAMHEKDVVAVADGLGDLAYVIVGTAVSYGLDVGHEVAAYQYVKPGTVADDPGTELKLNGLYLIHHALSLVLSRISGVDDAGLDGYSLRMLLRQVTIAANEWGVPLQEVFTEIHRSNMTKRLGAIAAGAKYGSENPKGPGYEPPNLRPLLGLSA